MAKWPLLRVEGFRGIKRVEVRLAPLTILTGRNNSGKSSFLEAAVLAYTSPGLRDWFGRDVVRAIVDGKLSGEPGRLIRGVAGRGEAYVGLEAGELEAELRIASPPAAEDYRSVQCFSLLLLAGEKGYELLPGSRLHTCIRARLRRSSASGGTLATLTVYALSLLLRHVAKLQQCSLEEPSQPSLRGVLPPILVEAATGPTAMARLLEAAKNVTGRLGKLVKGFLAGSIVVDVHTRRCPPGRVGGAECGSGRYVYLPAERMRASSVRGFARSVAKALAEAAVAFGASLIDVPQLRSLYAEYARLQLDGTMLTVVEECASALLAEKLESALGGRGRLVLREHVNEQAVGRTVYPVFRRPCSHMQAQQLATLARKLQASGLLEAYNQALKTVPGLGLRDPLIENRELYLYSEEEEASIPVALLGDGVLQLLTLLAGLTLARRENAVIVVEEPETGMHPGYLMVLAELIAETLAENPETRILAATHSIELIRFLVRRAVKHGIIDKVEVVLMSSGGVHTVFQGQELQETVMGTLELELRGL